MSVASSQARHAALAVPSRRRLLEILQGAGEPLDRATLAAAVGVHVTTARFHLDVLERAGLVHRTPERGGGSGRPRQLYTAAAAPEVTEGHRQLAAVLTGTLAAHPGRGPEWAEQAGRAWADRQLPPEEGLTWADGTERIAELFTQLGFAPRLVEENGCRHLELAACPFRDLARAHPEIVCTVHLGLLRGAVRNLGVAPPDRAGLRPFVEPELCIADLPSPE